MVRINHITRGVVPSTVLAKLETFNPGNSIKDRMAVRMIEDAEKKGLLKPGGTIIEGTSGNTGMGLAIAAVVKGYKCIFTTTDKQSKEKIDALKAFGAEVIVCPTNVDPEDSRSYYSVSSRLEKEIPNAWKANQYDNLSNTAAHYEETGPEIWEQTGGRITHFVAGLGTTGTIVGTARYLHEQSRRVRVVAVEPDHEMHGLEGLKHLPSAIVPEIYDARAHDEMVTASTEAAYAMCAQVLHDHGLLVGHSAGAALWAAREVARQSGAAVVVALLPDSGERYLSARAGH